MLRKYSFAKAYDLWLFMLLAPPRRDFGVAHSVPNPATWKEFQSCSAFWQILNNMDSHNNRWKQLTNLHKTPTISQPERRHKAPQHLVLVEASTRLFSSWLPWCLAKPLKAQWFLQIQEFMHVIVIVFIGIRSPQFAADFFYQGEEAFGFPRPAKKAACLP